MFYEDHRNTSFSHPFLQIKNDAWMKLYSGYKYELNISKSEYVGSNDKGEIDELIDMLGLKESIRSVSSLSNNILVIF